jgi:hypothetical protein
MTFDTDRIISHGWPLFEVFNSEETCKDLFINTWLCSKASSCLIVFEN